MDFSLKERNIAFIGAGKVGFALAVLLYQKGYKISGIASKTLEHAKLLAEKVKSNISTDNPVEAVRDASIIFLTVPESEISRTCDIIGIGGGIHRESIVIHTSGCLSSKILVSAKIYGARILSFHPLATFADAIIALQNVPGSYFILEGDAEALEVGREIASSLDGFSVVIGESMKSLYHAGASLICNYLITLMDLGRKIFEKAGVSQGDSVSMMLPLLRGALQNIEQLGVSNALTGPIVRGEKMIVESHLKALREYFPDAIEPYRILGKLTAKIVQEKSDILKKEDIVKILEIL